jgi:hypothetical protein
MSNRRRQADKFRPIARANASGTMKGLQRAGHFVFDPSGGTLQIDPGRIEVPDKVYDADVAWAERSSGAMTLFFAKTNRDNPAALKSRLEIRYPIEQVARTFWKPTQTFFRNVTEYVAKWPASMRGTLDVPSGLPASTTHSEWATFTMIAHTGSHASIDFYELPPAALHRFNQIGDKGGLKLRPVVRVDISIFELAAFLTRIEPMAREIQQELPEEIPVVQTELLEDADDRDDIAHDRTYGK